MSIKLTYIINGEKGFKHSKTVFAHEHKNKSGHSGLHTNNKDQFILVFNTRFENAVCQINSKLKNIYFYCVQIT